jgi:DNA gyrase/topoisomerase IV subunit A
MAIHFKEDEIRAMGLAAAGVNGIKLKGDDVVVGAAALDKKQDVLLVAADGRAKNVKVKDFPLQGRYGQGVIAWKMEKGQRVIGVANQKGTTRASLHLKKLAAKSLRLDEAPTVGRQANGKAMVDLREDDEVVAVAVPGPTADAAKAAPRKKSTPKKKATKKKPAAKKKSTAKPKPKTSKKKGNSKKK